MLVVVGQGTVASTTLAAKPERGAPTSRSSADDARVDSMTLEALLSRWLTHSREVEAWRSEIGAAQFDVVTASLLPNPSIGLESMGTFIGRDDPPDGLINFGVRIEMPLPIFGQRRARSTAATRALDVAQMVVATLVWERAADIREAAVGRAYADLQVELAEQAIADLAEVRRVITSRADAGVAPRYDAARVEILHASLEAEAERARLERDRIEARLVSAIADPTLDAAPVRRSGLTRLRDMLDETLLVRRALETRPDLLLERRGEQARLAEAEEHRIDARPTPSLYVGTYIARNDDSVNIIGGIAMPIPAFDRNQGLQGRAKAEARAHAERSRALEARIRVEVRGALRTLRLAEEARDRFEQTGVSATADLLERAWRAYQGGAFTIAELLDAYQAVWDSRHKGLDLERAVAAAEAELHRVTGGLLVASS